MEIGTVFAEVYILERKQANLGLQKNLALYTRRQDDETVLPLFSIRYFVCV